MLLNYVREVGGHLHAIDPHPEFDVGEIERANAGYLSFYPAKSLDAIRQLPALDLAMVDGDHNWYTVYNELRLLEEIHGGDPDRMPLLPEVCRLIFSW